MIRLALLLCLTAWTSLVLVSCSGEDRSDPDYNPAIGPFDENGNYVEAWADNPPKKRKSRRSTLSKSNAKPTSSKKTSREASKPKRKSSQKAKPRPQQRKPEVKPKPRPKPRVNKPKPKPKPVKVKPRVIRHKVKKGDTLYGLARRYGTTVSKIQKANRLSGTIIRTGSTLTIPK